MTKSSVHLIRTENDRDCVKTQPHSNPSRGGGKRGPQRGSRAGVPKPPFPTSRLSYLSDYTMVLGAKRCRKCCVKSFQVFAQLEQVCKSRGREGWLAPALLSMLI